jgi:anaerobic ribonucleoside-triphosphate reductase activating protein
MIRYLGYALTFAEVPDQASLCINITNCPHHCPGCHSPMLREDIGDDLEQALPGLLEKYSGDITCVCLMGEGNDIEALCRCLAMIRRSGLLTCLYTGCDRPSAVMQAIPYLDYLKTGHYDQSLGGLTSETTNQKMFRLVHNLSSPHGPSFFDITWKFWPKE